MERTVAVKMKRSDSVGLDIKGEGKDQPRMDRSQDSVLKIRNKTFPMNLGQPSARHPIKDQKVFVPFLFSLKTYNSFCIPLGWQ